ncbi:MAG: NAD(P)H-dependent dehydrogenase/reductase [Deltaproteobacteria bacterium]|nr:NAD(P)H-dependent dehydrogenase/reductase [Deltaproteobacteria bacterium]
MFLDLVRERRSIRRFLDRPVKDEKRRLLIEAALRSPSSRGFNPWEFIVVTRRELLDKLSRAKVHGSSFLKNAPLGIVVCADPEKCDVWIEDASIASIFLHLAAHSIGLGSCWIQIRDRMHDETKSAEAYVAETLNIPKGLRVESIIAAGYPDEKKEPHGKEGLQYGKVHVDQYGNLEA